MSVERNGHGPLWQPNQVQLVHGHLRPESMTNAYSVGIASGGNGQPPQILAVGGFTQLEALAISLAPLAMELEIADNPAQETVLAKCAGTRAAVWAKNMLAGIKEELAT